MGNLYGTSNGPHDLSSYASAESERADHEETNTGKLNESGLIVQLSELRNCTCESRSGCPGLSVLMSLTVSVDVKQH